MGPEVLEVEMMEGRPDKSADERAAPADLSASCSAAIWGRAGNAAKNDFIFTF